MKTIFYGKLESLFGRELELAMAAPCTVAEVRGALMAAHPESREALEDGRVRACVAGTLVGDDHRLSADDAVEFLAPVSGG